MMLYIYYSKNGHMIVSYTQRRKLTVVYSWLIHDCTTFTTREHVLIISENTVRTEGIQITLYFIMSSIYLLLYILVFIKTWFA